MLLIFTRPSFNFRFIICLFLKNIFPYIFIYKETYESEKIKKKSNGKEKALGRAQSLIPVQVHIFVGFRPELGRIRKGD